MLTRNAILDLLPGAVASAQALDGESPDEFQLTVGVLEELEADGGNHDHEALGASSRRAKNLSATWCFAVASNCSQHQSAANTLQLRSTYCQILPLIPKSAGKPYSRPLSSVRCALPASGWSPAKGNRGTHFGLPTKPRETHEMA